MNADLFSIAGIIYLAAMISYLFHLFTGKKTSGVAASFFMAMGAFCGCVAFALRHEYYYESMGKNIFLSFPVTNMFESVHFVTLCTAVIYLVYEYKSKSRTAGVIISAITGIAILFISISGFSSEPALFVPALQSYWLLSHVLLSFVSYACFTIAAVAGILLLLNINKYAISKQNELAKNIKTFVSVGFVLFTIGGMIFGAIWANKAWGRFWSWDPKESWAFITWCVYLIFVHLLHRNRLSNKMLALYSIGGLVIVIFTFLGVNILLSGLHSYANS